MNFFNLPVGKRTRHQRQLYAQGLNGSCGSSKNQDRKRNRETEFSESEDSYEVIEIEDDEDNHNESNGAGRSTKRKLDEAVKVEKSSSDESDSEEEESSENGSGDNLRSGGDDESSSDDSSEDESKEEGSNGAGRSTKRKLDEAIKVEKSSSDKSDSEEEESNKNGSGDNFRSSESDEFSSDESSEDSSDGEGSEDPPRSSEVDKSSSSESEKDKSDEKGFDGTKSRTCGSSSGYGQDDIEIIDVDDYWINRKGSKGSSSSAKRKLDEAKPVYKSLVDESKGKQSNANEDEAELIDSSESDSDGPGWMGYFPQNKTPNHPSANKQSPTSNKKYLFSGSGEKKVAEQDTESESIQSHNSDYLLPKEMPKVRDEKGKVRSINRKEKGHSVKKEMDDLIDDIDTHEKANAKGNVRGPYMTNNGVKYQRSKEGRRKDNGGSIDAILASVIGKEDVHEKEGGSCIPLKFRFDDSDDESVSKITDESDVEALFQQFDFELQSEEIGSYGNPKVENQDKAGYKDHDNEATLFNCERGNHGDIYLEEQTGLRCRLCGAVILESRFVIPKLANYAPNRPRRGYHSNEQQFLTTENAYFQDSDGKPLEICMQTKGTVWELIPKNIQGHLYPHQQEGFKFLWENLAGTIELQGLQKLGPSGGGGGGGGCIISHAPGTGKTLLTIVFIGSFLKKFPKCCPLIIVPSNMLDTWEAEFKKWQVGFSFINLNTTTDSLSKEMNLSSRNNTDLIRAIKIRSWCNGGSVLGVSYSLYEKIFGNTKTKNVNLEKMGSVLLDMPGLVILDEGHKPRNQRSNIWNILLKLKTKNRVILSGTPFQNNFQELFNTLRLVRPETATNIGNEKIFANMIQRKNKNKLRSMSTPEDIEKLKKIIAPFVNVHKGHILESKLPGLKQSIVLLNPPPLQKGLIGNLENLSNTFESEHKVALVSIHPSLISCILTEKEKKVTNKRELEKVRLHPDVGVKTRFAMEVIRLSVSLHEKVLIFSQYKAPLDLLKDQIAHVFGWDFGREFLLIKGEIQQKLRQTIISNFNDPKSESKVLLASTKCCSEGIHLIGASRVVLLDVVWNPSVETQAISRSYRLGQKKVVYTYLLMAAGTSEEDKYDRQAEKGRLAEMVFSSSANEDPKMVNRDVGELDDKILQKMVDHQELKDIFKKIRYPENKTRV